MKILSVAKTILFRNLRDVNTMLIMCAMPIAIIFILGLAFDSQVGSNGITLDELHITHTVIGEEAALSQGVETMMEALLSYDSIYEAADDKEEQLDKLRAANITAYIEIDEINSRITLYKNNRVNTASSIIETALRSFAARYNTVVEIAKVNPAALQTILNNDNNEEYIHKTGLSEKYQPSAMDYYGVVMTVLFVLYGFLAPLQQVITDRDEGLTTRVHTAPIKPTEKFLGNVIGYVSLSSINSAIVVIVAKIAFGVNWGAQPLYPLLILFGLIVTVTSLGMMLGEIFKSETAAATFGHLFIVVSAFFGGAYIALEDMGAIADIGKYFSLIWWANNGIMNQIYNGDYSNMITAIIVFVSLSVAFLLIALIFMNRKEAYKNG